MKFLNALIEKLLEGTPVKHHGVLGVFYYVDDVAELVRALRRDGHKDVQVLSPVPHHEIERALEVGPSLVRWVTFIGGFTGATCGFALCIYSMYSWPLVVGGKELVSLPPFVVIGYESMILLGALANLLGMLALARLPQFKAAMPYDPRFTEDKIGVWVPSTGADAERVRDLMRGSGAEEVTLHG
jgi:Protein of unknown function (DUF3341)